MYSNLDFGGSEVVMAVAAGTCLMAVFFTIGFYRRRRNAGRSSDALYCTVVFFLVFMVLGGMAVGGASDRYNRIDARHQLQAQGFTVQTVDLSHERATLIGHDGCIVTRILHQNDDDTYVIIVHDSASTYHAITSDQLLCDGN
jgi:hypothetical protein